MNDPYFLAKSEVNSNLRKIEQLLEECRKTRADATELHENVNKELNLLREDILELKRSVEVLEKDHERTRLGIAINEVYQRKEFIEKIESSCQALTMEFGRIKEKQRIESSLPSQNPLTSSLTEESLEQDEFETDRSFFSEQYAARESIMGKQNEALSRVRDTVIAIRQQGALIYQELNHQKPLLEDLSDGVTSANRRILETTRRLKRLINDPYHRRSLLIIFVLFLIALLLFLILLVS